MASDNKKDVSVADALGVLVEAAQGSPRKRRTQALNAINKHLKVFPARHKGLFTPEESVRIVAAAVEAMKNPANQVGLREKILGKKAF